MVASALWQQQRTPYSSNHQRQWAHGQQTESETFTNSSQKAALRRNGAAATTTAKKKHSQSNNCSLFFFLFMFCAIDYIALHIEQYPHTHTESDKYIFVYDIEL